MPVEDVAQLYELLAPDLDRYARSTGIDADAAEDLVQEAFVRFMRAGYPVEPGAARPILFRVVSRLMIDAWRRERRFAEKVLPSWNPPRLDYQPEVADPRLGAALAGLKPRTRMLVWLAWVEEYSHKEIAEMTGLRTGSVRVLLHRARRRLTAAMGGDEEP